MPRLAFYGLLALSLTLLGGLIGTGAALLSGGHSGEGFQFGGQIAIGSLSVYVCLFKALPSMFGQFKDDEIVPAVIEGISHIVNELLGNGLIAGLIEGGGFILHLIGELAVAIFTIF